MLTIHIDGKEFWDEEKEEFIYLDGKDITLEHSLLAISEWESKYHQRFLGSYKKSNEETLDYIRMMVVGENKLDDETVVRLSQENVKQILDYINNPMTATTFSEEELKEASSKVNDEEISSELIYYWMSTQNLPFEVCEKWHVNRLITLIKLCAIKNKPEDKKKKRMTSDDMARRRIKMAQAREKFAKK